MAADKAGGRGGIVGPAGRRAAANLRQLRDDRDLSTADLAAILRALGQPIQATGITKTEACTRRIDVDDLVALAVALGVSPNRLLLPAGADDAEIELTPTIRVPLVEAWEWATGERPLLGRAAGQQPQPADVLGQVLVQLLDYATIKITEEGLEAFRRENRPHAPSETRFDKAELRKHPGLIRQAAALVRAARQEGVSLALLNDFIELAAITAVSEDPEPSSPAPVGEPMTEPTPTPEPSATFGRPGQPVIAAIVTSDRGVLVTRRVDQNPPWGFVAGWGEPGESPEDTIIREAKEEADIQIQAAAYLGERDHPATGRHMVYYAARPTHGTEIHLGDKGELSEVRWVTLAEADELLPGMFEPVHAYLEQTLAGN